MGAWNYQRYGSGDDPIHKSHLQDIGGDFGCPAAFRFRMDEHAAGQDYDPERPVSGKAACGTAAHETIARALSNPDAMPRILAGEARFTADSVRRVLEQELDREINGRPTEWYGGDAASDVIDERAAMIAALLGELHQHVAAIELIEAGFIVQLGGFWLSGHVDLVYRPRANPGALALADWKTGATKPDPIELDHGWESGVYSAAVSDGWFCPRSDITAESGPNPHTWHASCRGHVAVHGSRYIAEREAVESALMAVAHVLDADDMPARATAVSGLRRFGQFPSEIYHVHLADYVPYRRAGKKEAKRPEDLRFYQLAEPATVQYRAGDRRGPAWLPVRRTVHDVPRLEHRLRNVVRMIRLGIFVDLVGEKCRRCPYAERCLNRGYGARGDERTQLEAALRGIDVSDGGL